MTERIFVIEDDGAISGSIEKHLATWGYEVKTAQNFRNVLPEFAEFDPHLVLVDIMLSFCDGYHWCRAIREISQVPVVFLSSASENMNVISAMMQGGDDFIAKPVDLAVLTAKLQAILRRAYGMSGRLPVIEHRGAILNLSDCTLSANGQKVELTKNEFRILESLMQNHGKVVPRNRLMNDLWQNDCYVEENTLTVNMGRLRKKLENAGLDGFVLTKPGCGYMIP